MSNSRMLSRLVLAPLVATLIAAPAASAMPTDPQDAAVATQDRQDARGEAAASGGGTQAVATQHGQDARGEAAASGGGTGARTINGPVNHPSFPGPPAFPTK